MIALSRALRIWRERRLRDQRGFALIFVLAVIALTSVTIVALIGMLFVSINVTDAQETNTREQLALDGAIEAATNQLRYLPGATFSDPCDLESPFEEVQELSFDDGKGGEIIARVKCADGEVGGTSSTGDAVRLVGSSGYDGAREIPTWRTGANASNFDWRNWTSAWNAVAGEVPVLQPEPNLVHLGREPLIFESGVTARNGAALLREDPSKQQATIVAGQYLQGSMGPLAAAGATGPDACGVLAGKEVAGLTDAGRISDVDGLPECDSASARNVDRAPTDAQAGFAFDGEFSGELAPLHPTVNNYQCPTNVNVIPLEPGRYDQTMVRKINQALNPGELSPGSGSTRVGQCRNQTFWFKPGIYYIDAEFLHFNNVSGHFVMGEPMCWDPELPPGPDDNSVRRNGVRNPANWQSPMVQAQDDCWEGDGRDQESFRDPFLNPDALLCDPEASGVTFILSPRTSVVHRAGYLGMCPAHDENDRPLPAMYQETSVGNTVELEYPSEVSTPTNFTAGTCQGFGPGQVPANLGDGPRCWNDRHYRVGMTTPPGNEIDSAMVHVSGFQMGSWGQEGGEGGGPHNFIEGRQTRIEVRNPVAPGTTDSNRLHCSTGWLDGMPTGLSGAPMTATFDLKDPNGTGLGGAARCADWLESSGQLNDRELRVTHRLVWFIRSLEEQAVINTFFPTLRQSYVVSDIEMVMNSSPMVIEDDPGAPDDGLTAAQKVTSPAQLEEPTWAGVPGMTGGVAGYDGIENALSRDNDASATPQMPCPEIMCKVTRPGVTPSTPFVHDLGIRRLTMPIDDEFEINGIDPNIEDLRLHLALDPSGPMTDLSLTQFNDIGGPVGELADLILGAIDDALDPLLGRARWEWFLRDMELRVELRRPSGETICVATQGPVAATQEVSIDLLGDGNCDGRLQSYADLQDIDLHLSVAMPCVRAPNMPRTRCMRWGAPNSDDILQVRPPSIDAIELRAATNSWAGVRPHSRATVDVKEVSDLPSNYDASPNTDLGAAFNVMGKAWLPLHDLDLHWRGKVTPDRPLISGDLVLNGLGSRTFGSNAKTGIVCCDESRPETRTVLLTAWIVRDGDDDDPENPPPPDLKVRVRFTDLERPDPDNPSLTIEATGHKVEVLDWHRCGAGGCGPPGGAGDGDD